MTAGEKPGAENPAIGLCAHCLYARRIESARESIFYLCERSIADPAFPKYPSLPVLQCSGYAQKGSARE